MSQRHLLALLEPLTSMLLQLQHHNELALYFTGVDSLPLHVSSSYQHFVTCCGTLNIPSNSMPVIALESVQLPQQQPLVCQLGLIKSWGDGVVKLTNHIIIYPSPMMLQLVPSLLVRTDTFQQSPWYPDTTHTYSCPQG